MYSKSINKIVELVNLWDYYEQNTANMTIHDFCVNYLSEFHKEEKQGSDDYGRTLQAQMAVLLIRMSKFATHYSKKTLKHSVLNSTED